MVEFLKWLLQALLAIPLLALLIGWLILTVYIAGRLAEFSNPKAVSHEGRLMFFCVILFGLQFVLMHMYL